MPVEEQLCADIRNQDLYMGEGTGEYCKEGEDLLLDLHLRLL